MTEKPSTDAGKGFRLREESTKVSSSPQKPGPGGELKALEQILSRSNSGKIPVGFQKRATTVVRFLFTITGVERAMVVAADPTGEFQAVAAGGFTQEADLTVASTKGILKSVISSKTAVLVIDAAKDPRFARTAVAKEQGIRSLLCVFFTDKKSGMEGVLYVDSQSTPNLFSLTEQKVVEGFAGRLANDDSPEEVHDKDLGDVPSLQAETQPVSPWLVVAGVGIALLLVLPSLTRSDSKPTPKPTTTLLTSHQNADGRVVLESYIRSLGSSNFRGAYAMLSGERKQQYTPEQFETKMRDFFSQTDQTVQFSNVTLTENRSASPTEKIFTLEPPRRDLGPWEATLQLSEGSWYISRVRGGPELP